jgi:hypothetical protein
MKEVKSVSGNCARIGEGRGENEDFAKYVNNTRVFTKSNQCGVEQNNGNMGRYL